MSFSTLDSSAWNGPICMTCNERYLGIHECKGHQCDATRALEMPLSLEDIELALVKDGWDFNPQRAIDLPGAVGKVQTTRRALIEAIVKEYDKQKGTE